MLVSQVISLAASSELRQLPMKDDAEAVIGFINLGMLELYKRFPLKTEEAIITLVDGKSEYKLDGTDANVSMPVGAITNMLVVSDCFDENGNNVSINNENDKLGIMTPMYNLVEVYGLTDHELLSVLYQVAPDFVTSVDDTLALPPQLLEALLHYIGYRGHSTITVDIKEQNNTHYMRFDQSCNRVTEKGLVVPDDMESNYFEQRGFV